MENIFVEFLPPWIETGLQPAFYDKESGTVLQQTARMYARVNMLIRMFNKLSKNTKTTVEDYINQFNELHDYVHDYFDNLDVQEQINHKLDEMVDNGTFDNIVAPLLVPYFDEQKSFEKMMNWENIECKKYRDETAETDYYITTIPYNNPYDGKNILRLGLANDDITCTTVEKPSNFAYRTESPVVLNAGIFTSSSQNPQAYGVVVKDGVILKNDPMSSVRYRDLLAIKANGDMACFSKENVNLQTLINEGYLDIFLGYYGIIIDGQVVDYSSYIDTEVNPREIICRKTNGDYLILTCDGRTESNKGLTISDVVRILGDYDISFAFVLDGGGSTGCIVKGEKINRNIDGNGTEERAVATLLYIESKASELYFQSGAIHNNLMVKEAETDITLGSMLNIEDYFGGNLFNKNDTHFLTNKYIGADGTLTDYDNTSGHEYNDLMLSDYIPVPTITRMFCVKPDNTNDWAFVCLFDKDKNFTRRINYYEITGNTFKTTENEHYCRVVVRKHNFRKFGIYIGNTYDSTLFEPYKYLQPKIIFNDDSGSRDVTLGYLGMYDKIKIYYTNSSSLENANEIAIPASLPGSFYTNLLVCRNGTGSEIMFVTARLSINTDTGVVTFDRECRSKIETTPAVTNATPGDGDFKIVRVEVI